jgi:hypothetical protein
MRRFENPSASIRGSVTTLQSMPTIRLQQAIRLHQASRPLIRVRWRRQFLEGASPRRTFLCLRRGDLAMMRATEHFQPAEPVLVGAQVVVAARTVPAPVACGAMVDFAVASFGDASLSFAEVLCSTLGG